MLNLTSKAFGALTLVLVCGSFAVAQRPDPIKDDARPKNNPVVKGESKAAAKMTIQELSTMLKSMNYQHNVKNFPNGHSVLELDVPFNGKMIPVDVELSKDGQKIWLSVWFAQLPQGQTIPAHVLNGMLEANGKFGPCHFFLAQSKQMVLAYPVDNRFVTAEDLRRDINNFVNVYAQTENLWNTQKWGNQTGGGR